MPDCEYLHAERKKPGVTLELLHLEYLEKHPGGYRYTAFCERYREWLKRRGLTMRQEHLAGEKLFIARTGHVDHAFQQMPITRSSPWRSPRSVTTLGGSTSPSSAPSSSRPSFCGWTPRRA
jgi:hypothetical protein